VTRAQAPAVGTIASLTFTTIDVPGAMNTNILGINNVGQMVGYYAETTNGPPTGFLLSDGNFTFFNYPGGDSTLAFGINDSGLICGTAYIGQNTGAVGFKYRGTTFHTIRVHNKRYTIVNGINNFGAVVGGDGDFGGNQGFELLGAKFRNVTPPGSYTLVYATGANNVGQVVGWTSGGVGSNNGFSYKGGNFRTINVPGANDLTEAWGVNDGGVIVGSYEGCSPCAFHGFVRARGRYVSLDYPGATATFAMGINNAGQIVGFYTFDYQTYHGFVTSPISLADFEQPLSGN
jgi:probable HAF family extracellular repeat protein